MLTNLKNSLTAKKMKFATKHVHKFPSHLKNVDALPCEIQTFENSTNCAAIATNLSILQFHTGGNVAGSTSY